MQENFELEKREESKASFSKKRIGYLVLAFAAVIALSVLLTFFFTVRYFFLAEDSKYGKFEVLDQYIDRFSYYEPDHDQMLDAALKAYVSGTGDRYAQYYNSEDFKALNEDNEGRFVGIGVSITSADVIYLGESLSLIEIVDVYESSPAEEAGLLEGDIVYSVFTSDGEIFTDDVGLDVISSKIKGEEGTAVKISVLRGDNGDYEKLEFTMTRRSVDINSVSYEVCESRPLVGIVRISRFDLRTPQLMKTAFNSLGAAGISRIILDMRGNPGGDLNSVVACASYFLDTGDVIISTEDNRGNRTVERVRERAYAENYSSCDISANEIGMFKATELVVLVDRNTASAAELLTAVFRDYDLAVIVGEKTYGKGTMQTIYPLSYMGYDGGIKITTNVYFPPCGENYDGVGITPHITVDSSDDNAWLETAINQFEK